MKYSRNSNRFKYWNRFYNVNRQNRIHLKTISGKNAIIIDNYCLTTYKKKLNVKCIFTGSMSNIKYLRKQSDYTIKESVDSFINFSIDNCNFIQQIATKLSADNALSYNEYCIDYQFLFVDDTSVFTIRHLTIVFHILEIIIYLNDIFEFSKRSSFFLTFSNEIILHIYS